MPAPPDRPPLLSAGTHLTPDDGACLMEIVSVLAGGRGSDQPGCTDPTLATVARVVNDEMTHPARQDLTRVAAALVGRRGDTSLAPAIVAACLHAVAPYLADPAVLRRHQRRATRRLNAQSTARRWWPELPAVLYARGPAQHAIAAATRALRHLPAPDRDTALAAMLDAAIAATPPATPARSAPALHPTPATAAARTAATARSR